MPSMGLDSAIRPRRPKKADYVYARRFRVALPLACRLWLKGER